LCLATMKFAAKYEILETFTRGSVETFAARKIATDEVVLVHIFECQEQQPNQPTVQWVLESFRAVAPDPCGRVVETGRYDETTSYGYMVTRLPEKSALQAWIQSYEARQQTGGEAVVPPVSAPAAPPPESEIPEASLVPESDAATRVFGASPPPERPEGITKEFEALRSELKPPAADQTPSGLHVDHADARSISAEFRAMGFEGTAAAKPVEQEKPGDFTRQFSAPVEDQPKSTPALSDKTPREERRGPVGITGRTPAPGTKLQPPPASASAETPSAMLRRIVLSPADSGVASGPDRSFPSGSTPKPAPSSASGKAGEPGTGEFTKLFRGPFDGERSAEIPDLSGAAAREEKDTGDFTKVFGRPKSDTSGQLPKFAGSPAPKRSATGSDPGSFTKLFESKDVPKKTSGVYESDMPFRDRNRSDFGSGEYSAAKSQPSPKPVPRPAQISADTPAPTTPLRERKGVGDPELPFSSRSERDAATRVFSAEREPVPDLSTLPAGPSEYTRVISGGLKKFGLSGEPGAEPQSSAGHAALPSVPPPMPTAPATPQFPPVGGQPQMPAPPPPPVLPAAQPPPLGAAVPKAAGPPWTMIIILNVLFLLALALVLYFVFRH
jgi:hypothetical protein